MISQAWPPLRIQPAGTGAVLLDCARDQFSDEYQQLIWAVAKSARAIPGVRECVPGMNNLMVVFDGLSIHPRDVEMRLVSLWEGVEAADSEHQVWTIPVRYGGQAGEDLRMLAEHAGLPIETFVERHAGVTYTVAALGAMAGYPYLSGLDPALSCPRRISPRLHVPTGSVIIGGAQAGIMPTSAPSGWHILGVTDFVLFDVTATPPARLSPGDTITFSIASLEI
ncbi:5-oxoprolinase subunit PxpB [Bosea vestrisii]|uniref:5-oxoprolinase subunit PxpB n=1 Tax=Bosea vestrisii TaxID=151416 RepID=UPI0024DF5ECE|nr:5-oxoprolinase subunit PxpB [Bosea vestrisii]WID95222.1 5-oxoprolinase subunit PxpB [Bosea vestrisii]